MSRAVGTAHRFPADVSLGEERPYFSGNASDKYGNFADIPIYRALGALLCGNQKPTRLLHLARF